MNIFAVDADPISAARVLPDKHVTKMILESAQMLSIVFSKWYWDIGTVAKVNGEPFKTEKGAFRNHPCTQWAAASVENCAWLIQHACGLTTEFRERFGKAHGLEKSIFDTKRLFQGETGESITVFRLINGFARAMPEDIKFDDSIDDITAYRKYMNTKPWVYYNYLRLPERRPDWILEPNNV